MYHRLLQTYILILLVLWTGFLFWDKQAHPSLFVMNNSMMTQTTTAHNVAGTVTNEVQSASTNTTNGISNFITPIVSKTTDNLLPKDYTQQEENVTRLETLYAQQPSKELLLSLIDALLARHRFDEAYVYVDTSIVTYPGALDPHTHIYAAFHAPSISISQVGSIKSVVDLIESYRNKNLISTDDYLFYQALIKLWYTDYNGAQTLLKQITGPKYATIVQHILTTFDALRTQKDIPRYYGDALVSLALMKDGYYSIAKKIATTIVLENKQYILPYQILAYSHFMTQNRDTAIDYFLTLRELESKQAQHYAFLIGVAYYQKNDDTQSILYLKQVNEPSLLLDAYRYMFLSYVRGGEYNQATALWQKMLGTTDISADDFYSYFDQIFFAPIREQTVWSMYTSNIDIASLSIQQCYSILTGSKQDVCVYGKAGLAWATNNLTQAKQYLDTLLLTYDDPLLFHALGDYYMTTKDTTQASAYYTKALRSTTQVDEQGILKKKLMNTYEE